MAGFLDISWLGLSGENWHRLLLTLGLIAAVIALNVALRYVVKLFMPSDRFSGARFWVRQAISIVATALLLLGLLSIWVTRPESMTAVIGMATAGLAFALQRVITSVAGYFIILRGKNFTVGDRISMGGVRGDVIDLGFIQTSIMEMGEHKDEPEATWVRGRQFTGRIVTVSNNRIFEDPVYNYTRDFPVLWEEIPIEFRLTIDRTQVERIMLACTRKYASARAHLSEKELETIHKRFQLSEKNLEPCVFFKILPHALQAAVRFTVPAHGEREVKDAITRAMLSEFESAGIEIGA
jgi:small-conductance mechanosensitive channel